MVSSALDLRERLERVSESGEQYPASAWSRRSRDSEQHASLSSGCLTTAVSSTVTLPGQSVTVVTPLTRAAREQVSLEPDRPGQDSGSDVVTATAA
jgi:hypothetical protein